MYRTLFPLAVASALVVSSFAPAQYSSNFEGLTASAAGTPLSDPAGVTPGTPCASLPPASQDCYYIPVGTTSIPWNVHTYSGNTLGINPNPNGGSQFIAGVGPGTSTYARAQRDILYGIGTGTWTAGFDVCVVFGGAAPSAQNIGSFSVQPFPGSQNFIALARWTDPSTAATWDADYVYFDAAGTQITGSVPAPGFQGLATNAWYRWETDFSLDTNEILQIRLTDIAAGTTVTHCPSGWYLEGGVGGSLTPTGFRWFAGSGSVAGNTLAIDNANIDIATTTVEYQVNQPGSSLDFNGATNTPCRPSQVSIVQGALGIANLGSTAVGLGWDIGITTPELSVPASMGGITTAGGQIINLNLGAPSLGFLYGLGFSVPFVPISVPFSFPAPVTLTAQMINIDPSNPEGISLSAANELTVVSCPNPENFDALVTGTGVYPVGWANGGGAAQWSVASGTTPSTNTGPIAGAFSPPNYMYCETSSPNSNANFLLDTCTVDTTGIANPTLNFRLSRIGATIGTLNIWQDDGTGSFSILLASYTGAEPNGQDWTQETIPFTSINSGGRFRFDYTAGGSFTGDLAIDDFNVQ